MACTNIVGSILGTGAGDALGLGCLLAVVLGLGFRRLFPPY